MNTIGDIQKAQAAQATQTVQTPPAAPVEAKESPVTATDIMKRMGVEAPKPDASAAPMESPVALDDIKDPVAKAIVEKKIKDLESGYNKKFQTLAEQRKEAERLIAEAKAPRQWTPTELQAMLKDPNFIAAAQALQAQAAPPQWEGSSEEWSALTPQEKQQFAQLNQRVAASESQLNAMLTAQEDMKLKETYPDYDPDRVNQLQADLVSGRYQATRADIWKVATYESSVQRAYELGRQDALAKLQEKQNGATIATGGMNAGNSESLPETVDKKDFLSIAKYRLGQVRPRK